VRATKRQLIASAMAIHAALALGACGLGRPSDKSEGADATSGGSSSGYAPEASRSIVLDTPTSSPIERDDKKAPLLRVAVFGSSSQPVGVPYLYGYPLYAQGTALQGVRLMRQDNWAGLDRTEQEGEGGVINVVEKLPSLDCEFTGIQEDVTRYVPLSVTCDLPAPKARGGVRPVIGEIGPGARVAAVLAEPTLAKAFLGEFHAQTPGLESGDGVGYFDTPDGLLGFGFKNGKLTSVSFVFAPPQESWRTPELWAEPASYGAP
jgi:hypothetical protein